MAIEANKVVTINYTLKDEDGVVIDATTDNEPFTYLSGTGQILPKLEDNINTMIIGSKRNVVLMPADGYGEYKEEAIQSVNRSEFPPDIEIEEGMSFMAHSPEGKHIPLTIKNIDGDNITVDFNHPLAGKTLDFDVELINIREATSEELSHGHVHGPDGHHH